jgi:hypothetical protein
MDCLQVDEYFSQLMKGELETFGQGMPLSAMDVLGLLCVTCPTHNGGLFVQFFISMFMTSFVSPPLVSFLILPSWMKFKPL